MLLPKRLKLVVSAVLCARATYAQTLTAADFSCFMNEYVAGSAYANCDGVGGLTPNDFVCYLKRYTGGDPWANCDGSGTASGWTNLDPPPGALVFYVAQNGSDTNPGTITLPFRSVARGIAALRAGHPDQCLLMAGHTFLFDSQSITKGSGSGSTYMVLGTYGATVTTPHALIRTSGRAFTLQAIRGFAFSGLDIRPSSGHPENAIWVPGNASRVLIEGCYFAGYAVNVVSQGDGVGSITDLVIRRNVFTDPWSSLPQSGHNLFLGEQFGVRLEENLFDRGGRDGGKPTIFRRNLYVHDEDAGPATVIGNIFARPCSGDQIRPGGTVTNNLMLQNPGFFSGGGTLSYNVALDSRDISPAELRGIGFWFSGPGTLAYNVAAYQQTGTGNVIAYNMEDFTGSFLTNVAHDWRAPGNPGWPTCVQWEGGGGQVLCDGSQLNSPNGGMLWRHESATLSSRFTYRNGSYFTSTPASGTNGYLPFSRSSGNGNDWTSWRALAGEGGSTYLTAAPPEPNARLSDYLTSIGVNPGIDPVATFMAQARQQNRANWRPEYTAAAVNRFVRMRFGLPADPT